VKWGNGIDARWISTGGNVSCSERFECFCAGNRKK
jgi:hypothetical protein